MNDRLVDEEGSAASDPGLRDVDFDHLLREVLNRVHSALDEQERLRLLLDAVVTMGADLSLDGVLSRIVTVASSLVDAIRRVAAGESLLDPAVTRRVLERLRDNRDEDEGLARLSDQERKILDYIAEGMTNRQIAEAMFLAEKTVKNYVSTMLSKLGMERRTEAAAYAARLAERRKHHD
jgi:DNA-binding NarL/FixJ family response regulator